MDFAGKKIGKLNDAEREEMAKKLDEDLDRFVDGLAQQVTLPNLASI